MKEVMQDPFLDELEKDLLKFLPQLSLESDSHQNHGLEDEVLRCDINDFGSNAATMEQSFSCSTDFIDRTTPESLHLRDTRAASTPEPKEILHLQLMNADLQNQLVNLSSLFQALEEKHNETLENLQRVEGALLSLKRECFDLHVSNIQLLSAYYAPPACSQWPPAEAAAAAVFPLYAGYVNQKPGPEESYFLSAYPALAKSYTGFSKFSQPGSGFGQEAARHNGMGNTWHLMDNQLFGAGGCYKRADKSEMISAPPPMAPFKGGKNAPGTRKLGIHRHETPRSVLSLQPVSKKHYFDHNSPGGSSCSSPTSASDSVQYKPAESVDINPGDAKILPGSDVTFARSGPSSLQAHSLPVDRLSRHRIHELSPPNCDERRATPNSTGVDHGTSNADIVEEAVLRLWDVSDQGMYKTEICNKWIEVGWCSYGSRCQFAHGMEELRYVLRHPRYKTELCRMVAAGRKCSYAHRCHFRHILTKEEKAKHFPEATDGS